MPLPAHRSLLYGTEQLPAYTPRQTPANDAETASIRSSAPSYVSAAPSYHSSLPPAHRRGSEVASSADSHLHPSSSSSDSQARRQRQSDSSSASPTGLPQTPQYAPGFESRGSLGSNNLIHPRNQPASTARLNSLYNASEWVPVTEGLQARHYRNVARRRVSETSGGGLGATSRTLFPPILQSFIDPPAGHQPADPGRRLTPPASGSVGTQLLERNYNASSATLVGNPLIEGVTNTRPRSPEEYPTTTARTSNGALAAPSVSVVDLPLSPHEDPDLVGEEAAARFRAQRLYMAAQQQQEEEEEAYNQQPPTSSTGSLQPEGASRPDRVYQYSSLVSPAVATIPFTPSRNQLRQRPQTSSSSQSAGQSNASGSDSDASLSPTPEQQQQQQQPAQRAPRPRAATYQTSADARRDLDEALRAQESKTWDFMLAQMSDWEERERSWKKYKDEMDKRFNRRIKNMTMGIKPALSWSDTIAEIKKRKEKERRKRRDQDAML